MTGRSKPTWSNVKRKLSNLDRASLISLAQEIHATIRQANGALIPARLVRVFTGYR